MSAPDSLPASREAEQSVLGGLLMDPGAIDLTGDLKAEHFLDPLHRAIFGAIRALVAEGAACDVVSVYEHLRRAPWAANRADLLPYLSRLQDDTPSARNIARWAGIVRDRALERGLVTLAADMQDIAREPGAVDAKVAEIQRRLGELTQAVVRRQPVMVTDAYAAWLEERAAADGVDLVFPTGLADYDRMLDGGMRPGELHILGARPSMGKTALAQNIAAHVAQSTGVLFLSMEMPARQLCARFTSIMGRVHLSRAKRLRPDDAQAWDAATRTARQLQDRRIVVDEEQGITPTTLRLKAAQATRQAGGLGLIVIDYLQMMRGDTRGDSRHYELEEISRGLKSLAKDASCAVLALVQVKREVEGRGDGVPMMSDIKDCSGIEQDADVIAFLDRPIQRKGDLPDVFKPFAKILFRKNRDGECGAIALNFDGPHQHFSDWSGEWPEEVGPVTKSGKRLS